MSSESPTQSSTLIQTKSSSLNYIGRRQAKSRYRSVDDIRRRFVAANFKASWKWVGGTLAFALYCMSVGKTTGKTYVQGSNNNGGEFLQLKTRFSDDDYYYNREFQKMCYLTETKGTGSKSDVSGYALADLGVRETNLPAGDFRKRAPHYKYY